MGDSPITILKLAFFRLPLIARTVVLNILNLSPNSAKQDVRTEVAVVFIRSLLNIVKPLSVIQKGGIKDPGIKGQKWISKTCIPAPETNARDLVVQAIKDLGDGSEKFILPDICDVEGEWTGYRPDVGKKEPRPQIPEKDQYDNLMKEVSSPVTILYFHGGAYFLMDPCSHREFTTALAKKTKGRCFSVRYRLAPQSAFPSQLLDAFISYLYLLSAPEGSFHEPVSPSNVVFAGDSAGANLALALLQLLLTLQRVGVTSVKFHGKEVSLALPAGIALNSPWCDITRSLPSITQNAKYDYIDPPTSTGLFAIELPADDIWPAKPPRAEIFCQGSMMTHPLASPLAATPEMWKGMPPAFMCCGTEGLEDEIVVLARRMYQSGAKVEFVGYEGMPHCFAMLFATTPRGEDCFDRWSQFCVNAVSGNVSRTESAKWAKALRNPLAWYDVPLGTAGVSDEEVSKRMRRMQDFGVEREAEAIKTWNKQIKASL